MFAIFSYVELKFFHIRRADFSSSQCKIFCTLQLSPLTMQNCVKKRLSQCNYPPT